MSITKKLFSRNFFLVNLVLVGIIVGFGLSFAFFFGGPKLGQEKTAFAETPAKTELEAPSAAAISQAEAVQNAFRSVAESTLPVVVEIDVVEMKTQQQIPSIPNSPWDFFFNQQDENGNNQNQTPRQYRENGLGSGVIVEKKGKTVYVLTNNHVAGSASEIIVKLYEGKEYKAELVGKDERRDLALVKFESDDPKIPVARLGDSDSIRVGDWAIAVGNPLGLVSSVTAGIVSALQRSGGPEGNISDFIQTDASINQGNSGGALVNIRGEVIGINTWIASPTGGSIGLGFAIPINNAKKAIKDLIENKQVKYGWLGVSLVDLDKASAKDLGLDQRKGAFVSHLFYDSPAESGGFFPSDFVIALNKTEVKSVEQLVRMVGDLTAGETVTFKVVRNGAEKELTVKIAERKESVAAENSKLWPGIQVMSLEAEELADQKIDKAAKGVFVINVIAKTPAATLGIKSGDIITMMNGKKILSVKDFYQILNDPATKKLSFGYTREGAEFETNSYMKK